MELTLRTMRSLLPLLQCSGLLLMAVATFSVVAQTVTTPPAPTANQPNASFGDIMLVPDLQDDTMSRVLIFYGSTQEAPGWGQICANNVRHLENNIADVICRQYGRKGGTFYQLPRDDTMKVWLYNISCPQTFNVYHILRCRHDVGYQSSSPSSCERTVGVVCSDEVLAPEAGSGYQGQVQLCPPNGFYSRNQSVSMGLVMLYFRDAWRTINLKSQSDTSDLLDSLCRQLGFTGAVPNTGTSQHTSPYSFDYCYDPGRTKPYAYAQQFSWLTTDQVDCKGSSRACSGCCYDYPLQQCSSSEECSSDDDLVISCTFDSFKRDPPSEGNSSLCAFTMDNQLKGTSLQSSVCAHDQQPKEVPLRTFEIVVGVLGPFALLGVALAVGCVCCLCVIRYRRRNNPEHQPIVNQPPPPHDDAGN